MACFISAKQTFFSYFFCILIDKVNIKKNKLNRIMLIVSSVFLYICKNKLVESQVSLKENIDSIVDQLTL